MTTQRLFTRDYLLILAGQMTFGWSFSTFILLPKYMIVELDASPTQVGIATALFSVVSVLLMPIVGGWADRGRRVQLAQLGTLLMAASTAPFLFVTEVGALVYGARIVQGLANAFEFVAAGALVTLLSPRERLGQALGLFGLSMLVTNALAPAFAEWAVLRWNWSIVYAIAVGASIVSCALFGRLREPAPAAPADVPARGLVEVLVSRRVLWFGSVSALCGLGFGAMFTFTQPYALELGLTSLSVFFVAYSVAAMVVRAGFGGLIDRLGRHRVSSGSLLLYVVCVGLAIDLETSGLLVTGVLLGLAHGMFYPAFHALVIEGAAESERALVFALFMAWFNAGWALSGILFGAVAERFGYPEIFIIGTVTMAVAWIVLMSSREIWRRPRLA